MSSRRPRQVAPAPAEDELLSHNREPDDRTGTDSEELEELGLRRPAWADEVRPVRLFELLEKYRRRAVDDETGLPFSPRARAPRPFSFEGLAFDTGPGLRLALRLFFPACVLAFGLSFLVDLHGLLRSCSVAGAIGFGTNWIAIKMLFWPREPRPVFGHGLIPSQRDQLVEKVADEVLEKLINEELILRKIDETRLIERLSTATIDKLRAVAADPEFQEDLRQMVLTYVAELTSDPAMRERLAGRIEESVLEFAGERFRGWMLRRMRELWRPRLAHIVNHEIDRLDQTLGEGIGHLDEVFERLPQALEARRDQIDQVLTGMLVGLVREVDLREIVLEQLSTVTPEQLEQGFREFSDDKLSFITLLGGIFGVIGGTVIVWPLPSVLVLAAGVGVLWVADRGLGWWLGRGESATSEELTQARP